MDLPNKLSRFVARDDVWPSSCAEQESCLAIYPASAKLRINNIKVCVRSADKQIDSIKFYVLSFLRLLINISIPSHLFPDDDKEVEEEPWRLHINDHLHLHPPTDRQQPKDDQQLLRNTGNEQNPDIFDRPVNSIMNDK